MSDQVIIDIEVLPGRVGGPDVAVHQGTGALGDNVRLGEVVESLGLVALPGRGALGDVQPRRVQRHGREDGNDTFFPVPQNGRIVALEFEDELQKSKNQVSTSAGTICQ